MFHLRTQLWSTGAWSVPTCGPFTSNSYEEKNIKNRGLVDRGLKIRQNDGSYTIRCGGHHDLPLWQVYIQLRQTMICDKTGTVAGLLE